MPVFNSADRLVSGVPLGGIGAGKIEILANGLFNAVTLQNNWSRPLTSAHYPGLLGYHLGFSIEAADKRHDKLVPKKFFLLQTAPLQDIPRVKDIRYEGVFPKVTLSYEAPGAGVEISLEAFSAWIPGDIQNSSLPAVSFRLNVKNKHEVALRCGFIFIGRNISGKWCVGRQNRVRQDASRVTLEFSNNDPSARDVRQGALQFAFSKKGWRTSFMESWNAVTQNFSFTPENISLLAWEHFVQEGKLPDTRPRVTARGENQELCGAVAAHAVIGSSSAKALSFAAAWHFPKHPCGHRYALWFKNADAVSRHVLPRAVRLRAKVDRVHKAVFSLGFPRWFNEALLDSLAPFFASSWYLRDGRFTFYEAPVVCPLMGTIDVGFYGSIPLSYFFPELELSQLSQFAKVQREDGYIPHDLGKNRVDLPSDGTTFYRWKDLNPKFVLMAYRDYLWSGDVRFLRRIYPHAKKAMRWSMDTDRDGNGLPDNEGADHTFDLWYFYGTNAYTSGIYLAALLACERMARLAGDRAFAAGCRDLFVKGSQSFEKELWNGDYFGETCSLSQLNGQWYADLLGLGAIADEAKIRKALVSILKRNARHSRFGMINSVSADGRPDATNPHSKNIWCGMNYAFASLALMRGLPVNNLLNEIYKLWDNVARVQKSPWNQPDMIDARTGRFLFGDSYYRNMAIWSIPIALSMKDKKTARILRSLKSIGAKGP